MKKLQINHLAPVTAALLSALVAGACTVQGDSSSSTEETPAAPSAAAAKTATSELRAAYIAAVQASAPADYRVERTTARLIAVNTAQQFSSTFTDAGVEVATDADPDPNMHASSWS
jgi:hypothetical protein